MNTTELEGILEFLRHAERLKVVTRTAFTSEGGRESVAAHTWRLCLMSLVFEQNFPEIDHAKLVKMCIIHDLGEAIGGDIPAIEQEAGTSKAPEERKDLQTLLQLLPGRVQRPILELWDEYEEAATPEAKLAKGLDKLETILQHNQGKNPPDFDYRFNLEYGKNYTSGHPLITAIRTILDRDTEARANESVKKT